MDNKSAIKKRMNDSYDKIIEWFASENSEKPFNDFYERPAMLSLFGDVVNKLILEPGCGAGWYTSWFIKNGAKVIAFDVNDKMVHYTKKKLKNMAEIYQADLNNPIDFVQDHSIDLIACSLVLDHIFDLKSVFFEFNKKLKNRGKLIFSMQHPLSLMHRFNRKNYFALEVLESKISPKNISFPFYMRSLQDLINMLLEAKFSLIQLLEPRPTEEFRQIDPEKYDFLSKHPFFLCIKAEKFT